MRKIFRVSIESTDHLISERWEAGDVLVENETIPRTYRDLQGCLVEEEVPNGNVLIRMTHPKRIVR